VEPVLGKLYLGIGFWLSARSGLLRDGQGSGTNADFGLSFFSMTDGPIGVMNPDGRKANRIALDSSHWGSRGVQILNS